MSRHVSEWLNAYHDGELRGSRLHSVEAHIVECDLCQAELESLESLSSLLHTVSAPEFTPPERLAAQVNLRLPHERTLVSRQQILEIGWWMAPLGLLAAWVFVGTSFLLGDMLSAARNLGLLNGISNWLSFASSGNATWSAALGQFGILSGNSLDWAEWLEAFARTTLPQIILQSSIALLYLSWFVIGWARRRRQGLGQLLEG